MNQDNLSLRVVSKEGVVRQHPLKGGTLKIHAEDGLEYQVVDADTGAQPVLDAQRWGDDLLVLSDEDGQPLLQIGDYFSDSSSAKFLNIYKNQSVAYDGAVGESTVLPVGGESVTGLAEPVLSSSTAVAGMNKTELAWGAALSLATIGVAVSNRNKDIRYDNNSHINQNINNHAPTDITLSANRLMENKA
ncbi:MAG: hypothetical protein Q3966_06995, partial [Neisseria sp.]|nr:hypothetical protein [Neisseria sp.]